MLREFYEGKFKSSLNLEWFYSPKNKLIFEFALPAISAICKKISFGLIILDIGCGGGKLVSLKLKRVTLVGCDISSSSLKIARKWYDHVILCDVNSLPFKAISFDVVTSIDVFGHIPFKQKDNVIREIGRVLKTEGQTLHHIETLSTGPLTRKAAMAPTLFKKYFISSDGHIGLEKSSLVKSRFEHFFASVRTTGVYLDPFWHDENQYLHLFDNEYKRSLFGFLIVGIVKCLKKAYPLLFLYKSFAKVLCKFWPLDWCNSIIVESVKEKGKVS